MDKLFINTSAALDFGGYAVRPDAPEKENSVFVGWELDGETFDFRTPVTSDITLKAVWQEFTYGDVNGDGKVNAKDVLAIRKYLVGSGDESFNEAAADVNADGKVNAKDVLKIRKYLVDNSSGVLGKA